MRFNSHHAFPIIAVAFFAALTGCGGSFTNISTSAAPAILAFNASAVNITAGAPVQLTAQFQNGSGAISPGVSSISSGQAITVAPIVSTTYTLTVSNSSASAARSITINVAPAPPLIAAFAANPATITVGQIATLTTNFANGSGIINPGGIQVVSGTPVVVAPQSTTSYTLTVTSASGATATASEVVTVAPVTAAASPQLGINIGWVADWDPTQIFADSMKQARAFGSPGTPWDESASVDANGWPTQDSGVAVIINNQGAWTSGTYALTFTGQAAVTTLVDANTSVGSLAYNSLNNTSSALVTVGPAYQNLYLVFRNTRRAPQSALGSGITNVSLMRPMLNGQPHPAGTLFTDRFLARLKYFSAIRMMDYLETNSSTEAHWADRSLPTNASQQQTPGHKSLSSGNQSSTTGASYEYAIQLANQARKDLWLTIPHRAFGGDYSFSDTTWATNLALLLKYGSDNRGNPYTGASGSTGANPQPPTGPVNPPLDPSLHVYIEWSNEFWSGVGSQTTWIESQAQAAINARDSDLDWDGDQNIYDIIWRINAKGVMLISQAFAQVYGPNAFGTMYRPIFSGQAANLGTYAGLDYLDQRHGGANQYVWAAAGAYYVDFNGDSPGNSMTAAQVLSGMNTYQSANVGPWIKNLSALSAKEQLQGGMVAYEGGQGASYLTPGALAAQTQPGMRSVTTNVLDAWNASGGATFFYYKLVAADMWGLSTDLSYDIDADTGWSANPEASSEAQPKWGAIKQVAITGK